MLTRDFVRILIFSGLADQPITNRFFELLRKRLFPRLIRETRRFRGLKCRAQATFVEHELLMGLHASIFIWVCVIGCTTKLLTLKSSANRCEATTGESIAGQLY